MITRTTSIHFDLTGTQLQDYNKSKLLFFDIETTGLKARTSYLYLIGAVTWQDNSWVCTQWFAENHDEEPEILSAFLSFAGSYSQYIHFNGDRFDLPYLNEKCRTYHISSSLTSIVSRDLYRMIRPVKKMLQLPALNQRSLEEYLGLYRKDPFHGQELISLYETYTAAPSEELLHTLLLHNYEDLLGMLSILPMLSYQNILNGIYQVCGCETQDDHLLLTMRLPLYLPKAFTYCGSLYRLQGKDAAFTLDIPGYRGALKYFFADYKNYYYLPEEDMAIHKSVAAFVDKSHRIPAKAATCYNRKNGFYLPQNEELFTPVFKTDYQDRQRYFACSSSFLENPDSLYAYVRHLLSEL